jgi:o-succinylbenzoate synthase
VIRIERIEMREIRLPLREPFRISSGVVEERRILLVRLQDADGITAWAECVAAEHPNYSWETLDTAWLALERYIAPRLLGKTLAGPRSVHDALERDFRGHRMAKAAVEMGAWALSASRAGQSLSRHLGGGRDRLPVGISLGIQDTPADLVGRAAAAAAQGYHKIKLKIQPGADIEFVRAVRSALPEAPLMVDANNAYTLDDLPVLQQLDAFGLIMIEQPLDHEDIVRHATLQRALRTPLCLDESITSPARAEDMIALGAGRIVNIKPGRVGGFTASIAIHDLCRAHGIPVWCGGMLESGIGRAYNIALATLPGFTIAGDLSPSSRYWTRDIVTPEWALDADGLMPVPVERPGIGVEIDAGRIDDLTSRHEILTG